MGLYLISLIVPKAVSLIRRKYGSSLIKVEKPRIKQIRYLLQLAFSFYVLCGGYRLYMFYQHFMMGTSYVNRPNVVDGFLPIGGLLGLRLWVEKGSIHSVHPAATIILLAALLVSLLFRKSFCGWICPIGTLSELTFKIGQKLLGKNFRMNRYADYFLRSIKYLFLFLVFYLTFIMLDAYSIQKFLDNSYWKIADIKMLFFFLDMSRITIIVLSILFVLSLMFKNFWCRYICPYGALTGLLSFFYSLMQLVWILLALWMYSPPPT